MASHSRTPVTQLPCCAVGLSRGLRVDLSSGHLITKGAVRLVAPSLGYDPADKTARTIVLSQGDCDKNAKQASAA